MILLFGKAVCDYVRTYKSTDIILNFIHRCTLIEKLLKIIRNLTIFLIHSQFIIYHIAQTRA